MPNNGGQDRWLDDYNQTEADLELETERRRQAAKRSKERLAERTLERQLTIAPEVLLLQDADGEPAAFSMTEHNLALLFAQRNEGSLRFDYASHCWHLWTGKHWRKDETARAADWVRHFTAGMNTTGAQKWHKHSAMNSIEKMARADQRLAVPPGAWNLDPYQLATPAGTIDLRSGEMREASPFDLINRCTGVAPSIAAAPIWSEFLKQVTQGDAELVDFLRQISGYCLTGLIHLEIMLYLYGGGGNGKGTFLGALTAIMGDYACEAAMDTFTSKRFAGHPTDLAMLVNRRMVTARETEEGRVWDEVRVKTATGGDPITAHFMRQDDFTYIPTFKLMMTGNHRPTLRGVDPAWRRRFLMAPFNFTPSHKDDTLKLRLREEFPQILHWMISGWLDLQANGLHIPESVMAETKDYLDSQDTFAQWMEECCERVNGFPTPNSELYQSWMRFCEARGELPQTSRVLADRLAREGFERMRNVMGISGRQERGFKGIRVLPAGMSIN